MLKMAERYLMMMKLKTPMLLPIVKRLGVDRKERPKWQRSLPLRETSGIYWALCLLRKKR